MRLFILVILLLCISPSLWSQDEGIKKSSTQIYIAPFLMADITPRLRMGVEYNSGRRWAYSMALGAGNSFLNHHRLKGNKWGTRYSLYEIRPEIKYTVYDTGDDLSIYLSSELFYIRMRDDLEKNYFNEDGEDTSYPVYYEKATFHKQKLGIHLKAGFKHIISPKIELDFYGGIGKAYRKIEYRDVVNPVKGEYDYYMKWFSNIYRNPGESIILHLALGCKVGWIL